jgi:hypothetical protein
VTALVKPEAGEIGSWHDELTAGSRPR